MVLLVRTRAAQTLPSRIWVGFWQPWGAKEHFWGPLVGPPIRTLENRQQTILLINPYHLVKIY